jgi:hypothetical protein
MDLQILWICIGIGIGILRHYFYHVLFDDPTRVVKYCSAHTTKSLKVMAQGMIISKAKISELHLHVPLLPLGMSMDYQTTTGLENNFSKSIICAMRASYIYTFRDRYFVRNIPHVY